MMQRFVGVLAAVLVTAGCGGGEEQARTVPQVSVAPAAETTPDSGPAATASPTLTETAPPPADIAQVTLTLDDMPPGWTTAPELLADSGDGTTLCGVEEGDLDLENRTGTSAEAAFKQSDFGPFVANVVGEAEVSQSASDMLDALLDAASQCDQWTETSDGVETTYTISPLSFDNVGDDTVAFRMTSETEEIPVTVDMVAWHQDERVALLMLFGVAGTDSELLIELTEAVSSRM